MNNYAAVAQRVRNGGNTEYALLGIEAGSARDAGEAVRHWCRLILERDREDRPEVEPILFQLAPGSVRELDTLAEGIDAITAWAEPVQTRCAIVCVLDQGLTEYPDLE